MGQMVKNIGAIKMFWIQDILGKYIDATINSGKEYRVLVVEKIITILAALTSIYQESRKIKNEKRTLQY